MDILACVLAAIAAIFAIIAVIKVSTISKQINTKDELKGLDEKLSLLKTELNASTMNSVKNLGEMLSASQKSSFVEEKELIRTNLESINTNLSQMREVIDNQLMQFEKRLNNFTMESQQRLEDVRKTVDTNLSQMREAIGNQLMQFEKRLNNFTMESQQRLEDVRKTVDANLSSLRDDNNKKLDEMRKTVDEKLQSELERRMRESFSAVGTMLERVQKDIGSMKSLAEDVGGLKRTLSNVKTRGMMGEFQLESILNDTFSRNQYVKNARPVPQSANEVEFALKIPTEDNDFVLLPIDSKFPRDKYEAVVDATSLGDKAAVDKAMAAFLTELRREAKDVSEKYIFPPYTTDYAVVFLPTESMYADAVNHDMLPELWRKYRVYITGPSTISALLSSMQLAFNNIAIQKRAGEVFGILGEVKTEFSKFEDVLIKMQTHLNQANDDLSKLMGVRSRKIVSKLNSISTMGTSELPEPAIPNALPNGTGADE